MSTFQWYWCGVIEPGVDLTVGSDTFHSAAKPSLLYNSRHRHWSGISENRLELSRVCGWANSKEVGCSYILSVFFFLGLVFRICYEFVGMKLYYIETRNTAPFLLHFERESKCLVEKFSFHATRYGKQLLWRTIRYLIHQILEILGAYVSNVSFPPGVLYTRIFRKPKLERDTCVSSESVNCRIAQKCDIGDSRRWKWFYTNSECVNKHTLFLLTASSAC